MNPNDRIPTEQQKQTLAAVDPNLYEKTLTQGVEVEVLPYDTYVVYQLVGGDGLILLDVLGYGRFDGRDVTQGQGQMIAAYLIGLREETGAYSVAFP